MMRSMIWLGVMIALTRAANAAEVTVKNDSLVNNSSGSIILGFLAGERAASWLTSPCDGNIVAAQIFWRSQTGGAPLVVEDSIDIYRAGTFPVPGTLAQEILGPQLTDGVINEYRYLDENNTIPLSVPVTQNETFILAFTYSEPATDLSAPSLVIDADGIQPNRNAIYGDFGSGLEWRASNAPGVGVNGDWVIRAVVDCQAISTDADVSATVTAMPAEYTAGSPLEYTITIANAGPAGAPGTTIVDIFPSPYTTPTWTCAGTGGATCPATGSGNITGAISLPAGSQAVYTVTGTVAPGTSGTLTNSATAVVAAPATDPDPGNNVANLDLQPAVSDLIFANGFEGPAATLPLSAGHVSGPRPQD